MSDSQNDSVNLLFKIRDIITKEPIPFINIRIQTEKNHFLMTTDFDGIASFFISKDENIQRIETFSNLYDNMSLVVEPSNNYEIVIGVPQRKETVIKEKIKEFSILKIKSRGLYLKYYGDNRFYKLTF